MPKMKTKKSAAKRFKVTGSGVIKRARATKRHILTKRTTKKQETVAWNGSNEFWRRSLRTGNDALRILMEKEILNA